VNRFNLTFRGEIVEGHDPEQVRARLAQLLTIDDPAMLQRCFSGDPVVLRRDLERKEAAELYARLRQMGIHVDLVKIGERGDLHAGETDIALASSIPTPPSEPAAETAASGAPTAAVAGKLQENKAEQAIRRADLATKRELRAEHDAELKSRERALKRALLAKEREEAKRAKANEKAQKNTRSREAKHKARLAAAKRKAERKLEQAEAAQQQATARAERERLEAENSERMAAERAEQARLEQARKEEKRRQAEETARRKAQEEEQHRALEEEQEAQRRAMEEQPIQRAATELAHKPGFKPVDARVKTRLETPSMQRRSGEDAVERKRERQPGAPNIYSLRPFRNTPGIRDRATLSKRAMRLAYTVAAVALIAAAGLGVRLATLPAIPQTLGPSGMAVAPQGSLLLVAGEHLLLHDRSGVSVSQLSFDKLGLANLQPPLLFDQMGNLLAAGQLKSSQAVQGMGQNTLLRCDLTAPACASFAPELASREISAIAAHPIDGSLFIADSNRRELIRISAQGAVIARTSMAFPTKPVLRLDSGLLLINSTLGPGISVYRYEDNAFGKQLDEVLLLPGGNAAGFDRVVDFVRNGEYWWVILETTEKSTSELYRYDSRWQFVDQAALAQGTRPRQLANWGGRTLVRDPARVAIHRFSNQGTAEAPLLSGGLTQLLEEQNHSLSLAKLSWRIGLALALLTAVAGLCLGELHRVRSLVYTSCRERGAAPVDELAKNIIWVDTAPGRSTHFNRVALGYLALATGLVLGAIGLGASTIQLTALLLALSGPAIALLLLQRSETGHIGVSGGQLLLVDHSGMYHFGGGGRIQHRGPFLMIDDVTVFTGTRLLPAFSPAAIREQVTPAVVGGVRVDRKIVTVKLFQARHPIALGAAVILATSASAVALLSLQGIF
tara:strand:- start:173336 stop:176038 length:2703 start_codon:yes stop_codon:yes gene_type:complete